MGVEENKKAIARLRRHVLGFALESAMAKQDNAMGMDSVRVPLKGQHEAMWVLGQEDRVLVTMSVLVEEQQERTLAATFLKEMADTRTLPGHQSAPSFSYSTRPPPEVQVSGPPLDGVFYLTFGTCPHGARA